MKIPDVKVTSKTTMLDSLTLRKALRDYEDGREASFTPGVGAFPQTRPGFEPTIDSDCQIHPDFQKNVDLVVEQYYKLPVKTSPSSYSIRREAKIGFPYNDRTPEVHEEFFSRFLSERFDMDDLGQYVYGTRIQTDSDKIRLTGYVQLKAIGDGFSVQRHRMINAGPAINHALGVFEFDYHHRWLDAFGKTFNCVVDNFEDTGYGYALDYSHYEHSLGWDILFNSVVKFLRETGRQGHADLYEGSNLRSVVHFRPAFKDEASFQKYLAAASSPSAYLNYVRHLYGYAFAADDLVEKTIQAMKDATPEMRKVFAAEADCPASKLSGYRVWEHKKVFNSSGVTTTATSGKLYSIADTMCRLTEAYGFKWDEDTLVDLLTHKLPVRIYNLGDDNLIFFDNNVDFSKFLAVRTGVKVTEERPVAFLSRRVTNEISPHYFRRGKLEQRAASFFRKLSRERDLSMLKYPSIGFVDSLNYAEHNQKFLLHENEIAALYAKHYMSFSDIIDDLRRFADKPISPEELPYAAYVDDTGKMFRDNIIDPSSILPTFFYAVGPVLRTKVKKLYGGNDD